MTVDFSDYFWVRKLSYFTKHGVTNSSVVRAGSIKMQFDTEFIIVQVCYTSNFAF
jgi:hypothetical protein